MHIGAHLWIFICTTQQQTSLILDPLFALRWLDGEWSDVLLLWRWRSSLSVRFESTSSSLSHDLVSITPERVDLNSTASSSYDAFSLHCKKRLRRQMQERDRPWIWYSTMTNRRASPRQGSSRVSISSFSDPLLLCYYLHFCFVDISESVSPLSSQLAKAVRTACPSRPKSDCGVFHLWRQVAVCPSPPLQVFIHTHMGLTVSTAWLL